MEVILVRIMSLCCVVTGAEYLYAPSSFVNAALT